MSVPLAGGAPIGLQAQGWQWHYALRTRPAIRNLDLSIAPGECVVLAGPSGSGKSTLLLGAAGLLPEDEMTEERGTLRIGGRPAREGRGCVGLLQQDPDDQIVFPTIGDDVAFGLENLAVPRTEIWPRVRQALDEVGVQLPLTYPTRRLSGGQKQRVGLAGIIAMNPGLWLLDEPGAHLDPEGLTTLRDVILRHRARTGATLIVAEHRVELWADVVERMIVLGDASQPGVLCDGSPSSVCRNDASTLDQLGIWIPGRVPELPGRQGMSGDELLQIRNLVSAREGGIPAREPKASVEAVPAVPQGLTCSVRQGEAYVVTGPNGVGKTTLALTLGGLLPPFSGSLHATPAFSRGAGPDPRSWKGSELIRRIGTVFQESEKQLMRTTVADELALGAQLLGRGRENIAEIAAHFRLEHLLEANPWTLSGGEKRRLAMATVLVVRPPLLILDEPTSGQDVHTWIELVSALQEALDDGIALVAVTHDLMLHQALGGTDLALESGAKP